MSNSIESSLSFLPTAPVKLWFENIDKHDAALKNTNNQTTILLPLSPLFDAAVDDDYLAVQSLLCKNIDVNTQDADGITALHLCAFFNCLATCDTLCSRRAFVNVRDNQSLTPLFYACKANCPTIVRTLVDHGADCNAQNKLWQTPMHVCALSSDASSAAHLINHVIDIDTTDEHGLTALHYACLAGNTEVVKLLINAGVNVNFTDRKQNSSLHWVSHMGSIEILTLLLNAHANPNCANDQGFTPLHLFIINDHIECVQKLLDFKANIHTRTHNGTLPIHFAAYSGNVDNFNLLNCQLQAPELTETDQQGNTLLHFAAATKLNKSNIMHHLLSIMKILLVNERNFKGQTPLHIAVQHNNHNGVQQLFDAGADASLVDNDQQTPLHLCISLMSNSNHSVVLSALVSNRPDTLCQANKSGLIPLHIALKHGDYLSINLLMPIREFKLIEQANRSLLFIDPAGRHSLHFAANAGLISFIQEYFSQATKEIINQQDAFGLTALHYSCIKWHGLDSIDILLKFGADVNIKCHTYGAIPLHYALVYCYSSDTIEKLLRAGSNVLACTKQGETCLSYGVMQNDVYLLKMLFDYVPKTTFDISNLLQLACLHGKDNAVEVFLDNNNNLDSDNVTTDDGMTPLMLACLYGHHSCIHLLIHRKVNVAKVNIIDGKTSLHYAAQNGQSECLLALLQELQIVNDDDNNKIVINLQDKQGKTALHYSVEHSSPNCIRLLTNFGRANPNVTDSSLLTPLHYCVLYNCEESLQELLDVPEIRVTAVDKNKRLPLHYAAATGNVTILSTLADYDYDQVADIYGLSPLHYAILRGHETAVRILLSSEVGLQCWKTSRLTPVHLACTRADSVCLKVILNALQKDCLATAINLPTKIEQFTPLHLAAMMSNGSECLEILLRCEQANVDAQDGLERTPIMYAIINGIGSNTIDMLLNMSKNLEIVDHLKNNILHYACLHNNERLIETLLRRNLSSSFMQAMNNDNQTPLDCAKTKRISPAILDMLFSLTGQS